MDGRDGFGYPARRLASAGSDSIVHVHYSVDNEVDDAKPDPRGNGVGVAVPAVDEDAHVVVDVQDTQLLLAEDDEHSVKELGKFRQREEKGPYSGVVAAHVAPSVAQGVSPAAQVDNLHRLKANAVESHYAEGAKQSAPHAEGASEVVGVAGPHVALAGPHKHEVEGGEVEGPVPVVVHPRNHLLLVKLALDLVHELYGME